MATSYTSTVAITTVALRAAAYVKLADFVAHLSNLGINLQSLVLNANNTVTVTLDNPLPTNHPPSLWNLA